MSKHISEETKQFHILIKILHSLRLILFLFLYGFIIKSVFFSSLTTQGFYFGYHMKFGALIFIVAILSLITKIFTKNPPSIALNNLEKFLERIAHFVIYFLIIAIVILGFSKYSISIATMLSNNPKSLYSGFNVFGIRLFSSTTVQYIGNFVINIGYKLSFTNPSEFSYYLGATHKILAIFILPFVIIIHVLSVLFHQFITKRNPIKRMF